MVRFFLWLCLSGLVLAASCLIYGFKIEPKQLAIREHMLTIDEFQLDSLRIGLISDIHIGGAHMPPQRVSVIIDKLNQLKPDIIFIAGDFVNGHTARAETPPDFDQEVTDGLQALKPLQAKYGVYAVIGNHDVWYDASFVETSLENVGINVLTNEASNLDVPLCILGFADHDTQTEDRTIVSQCRAGSHILALMHSPDSFPVLRSDVAFAVAGHTHGGQINIPFLGRLSTVTDIGEGYKKGLKLYGGIPVYISTGLGTSVLSARFRAPPEITVLTLSPKP